MGADVLQKMEQIVGVHVVGDHVHGRLEPDMIGEQHPYGRLGPEEVFVRSYGSQEPHDNPVRSQEP